MCLSFFPGANRSRSVAEEVKRETIKMIDEAKRPAASGMERLDVLR